MIINRDRPIYRSGRYIRMGQNGRYYWSE